MPAATMYVEDRFKTSGDFAEEIKQRSIPTPRPSRRKNVGVSGAGKHLVVVGTGQIGLACMRRFSVAGWSIRAINTGKTELPGDLATKCQLTICDRENLGELQRVIGSGADVVIDTIAYDVHHAQQWADMAPDIASLVVISSASVYVDPVGHTLDEASTRQSFPCFGSPIPESSQTVEPGDETYSTRKRALECALFHSRSSSIIVLRPCAVYGIGSRHPREWWFLKRILDDRRIVPLAYQGLSQFHTSSVLNIAELIYVAVERNFSGILNAADPEAPRVLDIAAMIASSMNYEWTVLPLGPDFDDDSVGKTPWSVPYPFLLDMASAAKLGYSPVTTYADEVGRLCRWLLEETRHKRWEEAFPVLTHYGLNAMFNYEVEDKTIATLTL